VPDVVISEFMDQAAVDTLAADFDVLYEPDLVDRPEDLIAAIGSARGLIVRNRTQVRGPVLEAAGSLRVVGRLGVGLDNIDLAACEARGVEVCPATGANDTAVAEYVIAAALNLLRGAYAASESVRSGEWPRQSCIGREIAGKRLGLVGFGGIARETAHRARALGMTVSAHDPFVEAGDPAWTGVSREAMLEPLLEQADVISLHVPLNDGTRGLIDAAAIARMRRGAIVINTARGGVVDEPALIDALLDGRLGGAALDVFTREPVDTEAGSAFPELPNLMLTPHIAGVTAESNVRVSAVTAENVRRVLRSLS
jgi:(S)-sulfolactate dehydrogenase